MTSRVLGAIMVISHNISKYNFYSEKVYFPITNVILIFTYMHSLFIIVDIIELRIQMPCYYTLRYT